MKTQTYVPVMKDGKLLRRVRRDKGVRRKSRIMRVILAACRAAKKEWNR